MIRCPAGILERRRDVRVLEVRIVIQYFLSRRTTREHVEDVLDTDAQAANAGAPAADFGIDGDAVSRVRHQFLRWLSC